MKRWISWSSRERGQGAQVLVRGLGGQRVGVGARVVVVVELLGDGVARLVGAVGEFGVAKVAEAGVEQRVAELGDEGSALRGVAELQRVLV
jgi:hypothetical protein